MALYRVGLRVGVHILPVHYYLPIANVLELEKTQEQWARRSSLPGLSMNADEQLATLQKICLPFQEEYAGNSAYQEALSQKCGLGYGYIEAQALHAIVRYFRPRRIVEVGAGVSTYCILQALRVNEEESGERAQLTSIEPHPSDFLTFCEQKEKIGLLKERVQDVSLELFSRLGKGDLLFIDSSHVVRPGGDVNHILLEIVPRLKPGVVVQFHDICLPYDYPPFVLSTPFQWSETSLLRAYLCGNQQMRILFSLSLLHYDRQGKSMEIFPEYDPQPLENGLYGKWFTSLKAQTKHFPTSIYMEVASE